MAPRPDALGCPGSPRFAGALVLVLLVAGAGCSHETPAPKTFLVGHHRVDLVEPSGWEHLDHGREQLFRNRSSEAEIALADLGPAPPAGVPDSVEQGTGMVLRKSEDSGPGREIVRQESRLVRGVAWEVVDTWSRVSHLDRKRVAWVDDGGYVLALRMKRGDVERAGLVFEALLQSIEVAPDSSRAAALRDSSRTAASSNASQAAAAGTP